MKAIDLINSSMRLVGVLASGEQASSAEQTDALTILNQMIDAWNAEHMFIFQVAPSVPQALTVGQQTYTLGSGGTINLPRPAKIERISTQNLNNPSQPLELPVRYLNKDDGQGWQAIPVKAITSTIPQVIYDDCAFPLRNLQVWPIPQVAVNIIIYGWTALTQWPDISTTDLTFPPGYLEAFRYNLAVRLAPEFGREPSPFVVKNAMDGVARIKTMNAPVVEAISDRALIDPKARVYNWLTDMPAGRRY